MSEVGGKSVVALLTQEQEAARFTSITDSEFSLQVGFFVHNQN